MQEDLRHTANTITSTPHHLPQQHNQPSTPKDTAEARHHGVVPQEQTCTIFCTLHYHEQPKVPKLSLSLADVVLWKSFRSSRSFLT